MVKKISEERPAACPQCGFSFHCICPAIPKFSSAVKMDLLLHSQEAEKSTNTGKLLQHTFVDCGVFVWSRTAAPQMLLKKIAEPHWQYYLVFPCENGSAPQQIFTDVALQASNKMPRFLILDATWQQARKMLRQSPWLNALPRVTLTPDKASEYTLRRNQSSSGFCTCEVGIALLNANQESDNAAVLHQYFQQFLTVYRAEQQHQTLSEFAQSSSYLQGAKS